MKNLARLIANGRTFVALVGAAVALHPYVAKAEREAKTEGTQAAQEAQPKTVEKKMDGTELRTVDETVGSGATAEKGKTVSVHYTGWLNNGGQKGQKFDSSRDRNRPFQFSLGSGQVIKGWDQGVAGMKVGGKRTLYIPSTLGYGARGAGAAIPPNSDLIFDVELLEVR